MSKIPAARPCSQCGILLQPQLHATTIDSNYNTVPHYMFGHMCPKQSERYDNRITEINNSGMNADQQRNARELAGYQNAWAS